MPRTMRAAVFAILAATVAIGCSSENEKNDSTKKRATGKAAAPTTKKPATTPAPQQKVSSTVSSNQSSAGRTDAVCSAADEGMGACVDEFAVFCAGGVLWALDCAVAFDGTCGESAGAVDCLVPE